MSFYQEMADTEKWRFRRSVVFLIFLANIFAVILIISYGASAWKELRSLARGDRVLEINVSGEGKVSASPDIARIQAAIVSQHEFLKEAQEANSKKSNVLVTYLKGAGIREEDIKTVGYNIYPQYRYPRPCYYEGTCPQDSGQPEITGYQVRTGYEITVRELAKASDILSGIVGSGANEVSGLSFTIDEPEALKAEARKKAVEDAKKKAKKLADDLERSLGPIVQFTEGGSYPPIIYERTLVADGKGGSGPAVPAGENDIMVTVSITYELR